MSNTRPGDSMQLITNAEQHSAASKMQIRPELSSESLLRLFRLVFCWTTPELRIGSRYEYTRLINNEEGLGAVIVPAVN